MAITTGEFAALIRDRSGLAPGRLPDTEAVVQASTGVLATLADQVTAAAAQRLAEQLPDGFAAPLAQGSQASEAGTMEGFYAAVGERAGIDGADVPGLVAGVMRAIAETADADAIRGVREQLTTELQVLLQTETGEGDTTFRGEGGPIEPDAPNVAGPEAPV